MHLMSLTERITQAKTQAETETSRRRLEIQRGITEAAAMQVLATQQEERRQGELIKELSSLLAIVGARELLEELRQLWHHGKIDNIPELRGFDIPTPSFVLGLRFTFRDLNVHTSCSENNEWHSGSSIGLRNAGVLITISAKPTVASSYGLLYDNGQEIDQSGSDVAYYNQHRRRQGPQSFSINDPSQARQILEDQLVNLVASAQSPQELMDEAKGRIWRDKFIPFHRKFFL